MTPCPEPQLSPSTQYHPKTLSRSPSPQGSHMAMGVQRAVGELNTMEGHRLPHPVGTCGRGVGVNVDTVRQAGLSFAARLPVLALPAVSSSIHRNHVQKEQVASLRVQASD